MWRHLVPLRPVEHLAIPHQRQILFIKNEDEKNQQKNCKNLIAGFEIALLSLTYTTHRVNSPDLRAPPFPHLPAVPCKQQHIAVSCYSTWLPSALAIYFPSLNPQPPQFISRCFHCNSMMKTRHMHLSTSHRKENLSSSFIFTTDHNPNNNMHFLHEPGPMFHEFYPFSSRQISWPG